MTPTGSPRKTNTTTTLTDVDDDETEDASPSRVVTVSAAASVEDAAPDYLEFDVVDPDSEALPRERERGN